MKQPRPDFFACAGFAGNKHRALDRGGALRMMSHARYREIATNHEARRVFRRKTLEQTKLLRSNCCHLLLHDAPYCSVRRSRRFSASTHQALDERSKVVRSLAAQPMCGVRGLTPVAQTS